MTRFFFQANIRGVTVAEDIGEMFPTLRDAEAHAAIVASELSHNSPSPVTVSVLSEGGAVLASTAAATE
jgi:uncharacterized protein DUF6894